MMSSAATTTVSPGGSVGSVTAPVCAIFGAEDFASMHPGDVLVAVNPTPAWAPLFALASVVVTDIGGSLSHNSMVAREYGIPAVMATRSATRRIHTGQMVTVDGSAGTVELNDMAGSFWLGFDQPQPCKELAIFSP